MNLRGWWQAEYRALFAGSGPDASGPWHATPLHRRVAGSKLVGMLGLLITSAGGVCATLGDEWVKAHMGAHFGLWCGRAIFFGALITAFGKSLTDRRTTAPPKQPDDAGPQ